MSDNERTPNSKRETRNENQESTVSAKKPSVETVNIEVDNKTEMPEQIHIINVLNKNRDHSAKPNENVEEILNSKTKETHITMPVIEAYYLKPRPEERAHQYQGGMPNRYAGATGGGESFVYDDPGSRNQFIKFIFIIVLILLLVTAAFVAYVLATPDVRKFFRRHALIFLITGIIVLLVCEYAMYLSQCTRVPPCNWMVLGLSSVGMSIMAATITSRYRTELVLYAVLATAAVVLVCILLACSKFDFTSWLLYVIVIATVFSVLAMIVFIASVVMGYRLKPLHIAILVIGTLIQVVMLVIELQMILGGRAVELNEDDYALGAFMMYSSIMTLFMHLMQIIGFADG